VAVEQLAEQFRGAGTQRRTEAFVGRLMGFDPAAHIGVVRIGGGPIEPAIDAEGEQDRPRRQCQPCDESPGPLGRYEIEQGCSDDTVEISRIKAAETINQIDMTTFQGKGRGGMPPLRHFTRDCIEECSIMVGQHPVLTGVPDTGRQMAKVGARSRSEIEQTGIFFGQRVGKQAGQALRPRRVVMGRAKPEPLRIESPISASRQPAIVLKHWPGI